MLDRSLSCFLEYLFIVPVRVVILNDTRLSVVLSQPDVVHYQQKRILIDITIASQPATHKYMSSLIHTLLRIQLHAYVQCINHVKQLCI